MIPAINNVPLSSIVEEKDSKPEDAIFSSIDQEIDFFARYKSPVSWSSIKTCGLFSESTCNCRGVASVRETEPICSGLDHVPSVEELYQTEFAGRL